MLDNAERNEESGSQAYGLYEGFEEYRTPSEQAIRSALQQGLVVVDTNVLLHLYRYDEGARNGLIEALRLLGPSLFVPHQAVEEFWRNREGALRDRTKFPVTVTDRLDGLEADAAHTIREWANRINVPNQVRDHLIETLRDAFSESLATVKSTAAKFDESHPRDTESDPVLLELDKVLAGRRGRPMSQSERATAITEAARRITQGLPPGFRDAKKPAEEAAGDYLLWEQTLVEAARRGVKAITLITGDTKDDWWRREQGELRGPRLELCKEAVERTGARLFMLRPQSFLIHAKSALGLDIQPEAVRTVERADNTDSGVHSGWTDGAVKELLHRLRMEAPVQFAVLVDAARTDGHVTRERVYEIGEYDEERTLRGFLRPVSRISQELRDQGWVSQEAADAMVTVYNHPDSWVLASGFRVTDEVLSHLRDMLPSD